MADDSQAFQVCELRLTDCQSVGVRSAGSGVDGGSRHGMLKHMFCRGSGKPGLSQTGESKEEAMELVPLRASWRGRHMLSHRGHEAAYFGRI